MLGLQPLDMRKKGFITMDDLTRSAPLQPRPSSLFLTPGATPNELLQPGVLAFETCLFPSLLMALKGFRAVLESP
jgi:hypothetical protein